MTTVLLTIVLLLAGILFPQVCGFSPFLGPFQPASCRHPDPAPFRSRFREAGDITEAVSKGDGNIIM
jgi:hypothetical protein